MALFIAVSSACTDERMDGEIPDKITGKEVNVKVLLQMPASTPPKTYAISEIDENYIETIDVLVFKPDESNPTKWGYAYRAEGTSIADRTDSDPRKSKKQFNVELKRDNDNEQCLVILANAHQEVENSSELIEGRDKDELLACLEFDNGGVTWNANNNLPEDDLNKTFTPFPMWGEVTLIVDDSIQTIPNVNLLRAIARMDVAVADGVGFKLKEINIYNSLSKGKLVPATANLDGSNPRVIMATIPDDNDISITSQYSVPQSMETAFLRSMYVLETKAAATDKPEEATCIIVGGSYGADTGVTYYRLDFFKKDADNNFTKDYADILRNHRYRVNITKVSGRGYASADEAFNSKPMNTIDYEITRWNDSDMMDVVFDNNYMLAVGPGEFTFPKDGASGNGEQNQLHIQTDYPGRWKAEIVDADYGTPLADEWVKFGSPDDYSGDANTKATRQLIVSQNNGSGDRSAKIVITAGKLRYEVIVKQTTVAVAIPTISLQIIDNATGAEITELSFASAKDILPASRVIKFIRTPETAEILVMVSSLGSTPLFKFKDPMYGISTGTIPGGPGEMFYNIEPAAFTNEDFVGNPSPKRMSKADFRITNGTETITKTLYLKHISN